MLFLLHPGKEVDSIPSLESLGADRADHTIESMLEMVSRSCRLETYTSVPVPQFEISGEILAYTSPDSTFAATKKLLDAALKSIQIGIYDFSAGYMADLLKDAMSRGVKVTLMLDTDHVKGEDEIFQELQDFGAKCVPAPSCASTRIHVFRSSHEKTVIIDGEICLVQSGNYSGNSIPLNTVDGGDPAHFKTGNRDMGVAVRSKPLARFLAKILDSDMDLELNTPESLSRSAVKPPPMLLEATPKQIPETLFPSKTFKLTTPLKVQPILSPDNYMQVIPGILAAAKKSVLIEQQYIHSADAPIAELLDAIRQAWDANPALDVRIVLGKIFSNKDLEKEKINLANMEAKYGLKIARNIRYINTSQLVHCHNKTVIIDAKTILVSSQNWSRAAVLENREAGLLFTHKGTAGYFTKIFETDWKSARKALPASVSGGAITTQSLRSGGFIEVAAADYQQL